MDYIQLAGICFGIGGLNILFLMYSIYREHGKRLKALEYKIDRDIKRIEELTTSNIIKYYTTNKDFFISVNEKLEKLESQVTELRQTNNKA